MSAHGPMPKSAWIFPALAMLLFAVATGLGLDFTPSVGGLFFVLATITLSMPNYTLTAPGPIYSAAQLGFVDLVTLMLYGVFLYTQTIRHSDYFIKGGVGAATETSSLSNRMLALSIALLLISLLGVVLLAKKF